MICQRCGKEGAERYHRYTMYQEEEKNYAICCKDCQKLDDEEMADTWENVPTEYRLYRKRIKK